MKNIISRRANTYHTMVDDGDISLSQALAKYAESQKYLAQVLHNDIKVQETNQPVVMRSAAEARHERRRNSFGLQRNIMALATGMPVIHSYDDDDVRHIGRDPIVRMHAAASAGTSASNTDGDKVEKSYRLMRLLTGGR